MIKIIDNQLPENLLLECIREAENIEEYTVLHGAGDGTTNFKYSWHFFHSKNHDDIKNKKIKDLWNEIQKHLPEKVRLHRGYVNAHTYGVEDLIHVDDPELEKGLTIIVYLCRAWYPEWFGQTMFFSSSDRLNHNEIVQSVIPKFNRVLMFDTDISHCVSPLSRRFTGVRLTCMFKVEVFDENTHRSTQG
jgi:Rps23 Pro-64 3,4-dihydroxylase Tpa1-like proline 4-hydroxylase